MDLLRSCYTTLMQFDQDGLLRRKVRWYVCPPHAKLLEGPSVFRSNNYGDLAGDRLGPGEVWSADRPWNAGATPTGATGKGPPCGDPVWFEIGTPSDAPPLTIVRGLATCCQSDQPSGSIGVKAGLARTNDPPCYSPEDLTGATLRVFGGGFATVGPLAATTPGSLFCEFQFSATYGGSPQLHVVDIYSQAASGCMALFSGVVYTPGGLKFYATIPGGTYTPVPGSRVFRSPAGDSAPFDLFFVLTIGTQHVAGSIGFAVGVQSAPEIGLAAGIVSMQRATYKGSVGVAIDVDAGHQHGKIGVEVSPASALTVHVAGTVGVEVSPASSQHGTYAGTVGVEVSPASSQHGTYAGTVGVAVAPVSQYHGVWSGTVGVKVSPASALIAHVAGTVGAEVSPASALIAHVAGKIGVEASPASSHFDGIVTSCCGPATPLTLTVVNGSSATTTTYSAAAGGWPFTDPVSGVAFTLKCVSLGGGSFQWQAVYPGGPHCTQSHTLTSLTCDPFSVTLTTHVIGAICIDAGAYTFTIHA